MKFLKKIFKPVSKVLDKVIPNEIKPFLPYAAAFAPMFAPGIMGAFGGSALSRAAIGGGLNIAGQLSQEGNEGDINLLSAGLGALSGAMTTPGGKEYFNMRGELAGEGTGLMSKAKQFGFETLGKGADIMQAGIADPFSKAGLKAAALPAATATGDLMFAQAKRDQDEYDQMMEEDAAADAASDAQRAFAIRRAMEATGATEEEIEDAIYAAGYKTGGRVGLRFGGIGNAVENIEDAEMKEAVKFAMQDMDIPIMDLVEEFEIQFKRKPNSMEELKQFYKDRYEYKGPADVKMKEEIKEKVVMEAKDGGRIGFSEGSNGKSMNEIRVDEMMTIAKDIRENNDVSYGEASDLADIIDYYKYGKGQSETYTGNNPIIKFHLNMKADGGLMNLGGKEMDLRKGGFVPIGKKEKADDVPARLSKNEFVMTADAVRAAGGGSVNKGAKRMYNLMNTLEAKA